MLRLNTAHKCFITTLKDVEVKELPPTIRERVTFHKLDLANLKMRLILGELSDEQRIQLALKDLIEHKNIDLYWSPNPLMPNVILPAKIAPCKFVATVFDLIPLKFKEHYFKRWPPHVKDDYIKRLTEKLPGFDRLMAISWSTKTDMIDCLGISKNMVEITYLGVNDQFCQNVNQEDLEGAKKKFSLKNDFIMYTGGFDFRKNMERLVYGFSRFLKKYKKELDLVIVCAYDNASIERFNRLLKEENIKDRIILTNHVSETELVVLYKMAKAFIFPSLYEGFGLPVLEAMVCGTPIAASAFSSIPEVLKNYGLYFDPYNVEEIADSIHQILYEKDTSWFSKGGVKSAKNFTWQATAQKTINIFECLVYEG